MRDSKGFDGSEMSFGRVSKGGVTVIIGTSLYSAFEDSAAIGDECLFGTIELLVMAG